MRPRAVDVSLRDYRPSDFESLWRLDQECFAPGIAYARSELRTFLARERAEVIVADAGGRVVGFVLGSRRGRRDGHVITLDVATVARKHGLGRRLLTELERRFRTGGVTRVRLETAVDNTDAITLYEHLGYSKTSRRADYYGPGLHAWTMEKMLDGRRLAPAAAHSPDSSSR